MNTDLQVPLPALSALTEHDLHNLWGLVQNEIAKPSAKILFRISGWQQESLTPVIPRLSTGEASPGPAPVFSAFAGRHRPAGGAGGAG